MTMHDDDSALHPVPGVVTVYAIYDHPRDHPYHFVVRPWDIVAGRQGPRYACGLFDELDKARAYCAQFGLKPMKDGVSSDPVIVEVWV
jgi:hypothetical protein